MKIKAYIWIILGAVSLILNWLFGVFPAFYEVVYFNGIFQVMRVIYDFTLGWIPFPMVYILILCLVQIIYLFLRFKGFRAATNPLEKIKSRLMVVQFNMDN